jgi:hypothetical protein
MVPPAWEHSRATPQCAILKSKLAAGRVGRSGRTRLHRWLHDRPNLTGLRPLRYTLTSDGLLVVGSEWEF